MTTLQTPTSDNGLPRRYRQVSANLDELTYSVAGFPVSLSRTPEEERARQTTASSGRTSWDSYASSDPDSSWSRTFTASLLLGKGWYSRVSSLTWRVNRTKLPHRLYFRLLPSVPHTEGIGSGFVPTPDTTGGSAPQTNTNKKNGPASLRAYVDLKDGLDGRLMPTPRANEQGDYTRDKGKVGAERETLQGLARRTSPDFLPTPTATSYGSGNNYKANEGQPAANRASLETMARRGMLSTPTVRDGRTLGHGWSEFGNSLINDTLDLEQLQVGKRMPKSLDTVTGMLPTPQAQDWKSGTGFNTAGLDRGHSPQLRHLSGGLLNPRWVEWLMGLPAGWVSSKDLEMPSSPSRPGESELHYSPAIEPWPTPKASAAHYGQPRPNDRDDLQAEVLKRRSNQVVVEETSVQCMPDPDDGDDWLEGQEFDGHWFRGTVCKCGAMSLSDVELEDDEPAEPVDPREGAQEEFPDGLISETVEVRTEEGVVKVKLNAVAHGSPLSDLIVTAGSTGATAPPVSEFLGSPDSPRARLTRYAARRGQGYCAVEWEGDVTGQTWCVRPPHDKGCHQLDHGGDLSTGDRFFFSGDKEVRVMGDTAGFLFGADYMEVAPWDDRMTVFTGHGQAQSVALPVEGDVYVGGPVVGSTLVTPGTTLHVPPMKDAAFQRLSDELRPGLLQPTYETTAWPVIVADPAWRFDDKLPGKGRGAATQYETMDWRDIARFPLPTVADDAILFLWSVTSMLKEALLVMETWGFRQVAALTWVKKTQANDVLWFGMGRYTRGSHETCLIGVRGKATALIQSKSVRSVFEAPVGAHSEKPDKFYELVEELVGGSQTPKLELFARKHRGAGWLCLGDQVDERTDE